MADPIDAHVGKALRTLRHTAGVTQQSLAEAMGITFQQVQKYESGKNRISASRLKMAADALGVSVGDFFRGLDDGSNQGDIAAVLSDAVALKSACEIHALPPLARDGLLNILATMTANAA